MREIDFDTADELTFLRFIQDDVLSRQQALRHYTPSAIRHRLRSGRWQRPHRGVFLTSTGEVTRQQERWIAVLAAGASGQALLGGRTALEVHGLKGFPSPLVHVLLAAGRRFDNPPPWVVVHRTRHLHAEDVHGLARPPRTMPARSVVDAAQWAVSDREACTVIAMAFQQGKVALEEIQAVLTRMPNARRAALIAHTAADSAAGAHSLAELEFLALSRRAGFPQPRLQAVRRDASGGRRYLDALYEEYGVHVEIDGVQHTDVQQAWADMRRLNEIWIAGERVLRFPGWLVRQQPDEVIAQLGAALMAGGWRPE